MTEARPGIIADNPLFNFKNMKLFCRVIEDWGIGNRFIRKRVEKITGCEKRVGYEFGFD